MFVNVTRSVSRLIFVFVSLINNIGGARRSVALGMKAWNGFFSPAYPDNSDATSKLNVYTLVGEFDLYTQIGSTLVSRAENT